MGHRYASGARHHVCCRAGGRHQQRVTCRRTSSTGAEPGMRHASATGHRLCGQENARHRQPTRDTPAQHESGIRYRTRARRGQETPPGTRQHASAQGKCPARVPQPPSSGRPTARAPRNARPAPARPPGTRHPPSAMHRIRHCPPPPPRPRVPTRPTPRPPPPQRPRRSRTHPPVEPHHRSRTPARTRGAPPTMPTPRAREAPPATADACPGRTPPTKPLTRTKPRHRARPPTQPHPHSPANQAARTREAPPTTAGPHACVHRHPGQRPAFSSTESDSEAPTDSADADVAASSAARRRVGISSVATPARATTAAPVTSAGFRPSTKVWAVW